MPSSTEASLSTKISAVPSQLCKSGSSETFARAAGWEEWICFEHESNSGIFAERHFAQGEVIERAPVLLLPREHLADVERGRLTKYCCAWGEGQALVLGFVPFYSDSGRPNAFLIKTIKALTVEVVAMRDIGAGEKIVVSRMENGRAFWLTEPTTTSEGPIHPGRFAKGCQDLLEREQACRESERQALVEAERRSASMERRLAPLSLSLADDVKLDLVAIAYGVFLIGAGEEDREACSLDRPQHTRFLDDYFIGRYPVTVRQFAAFVEATGYRTLAEQEGTGFVRNATGWRNLRGADWRDPLGPESNVRGKTDHPVTLVSWDDAVEFCRWASRVTRSNVSLPSELEWEKAARGIDGRLWPWGGEPPDTTLCNYQNRIGDTTPVGRYSPDGDSPYHCADMAGNVWEWTASHLRMYPYEDKEQRGDRDVRIVRGGAFHLGQKWIRCSRRYWHYCRERLNCCGFRVKVSWEEQRGGSR